MTTNLGTQLRIQQMQKEKRRLEQEKNCIQTYIDELTKLIQSSHREKQSTSTIQTNTEILYTLTGEKVALETTINKLSQDLETIMNIPFDKFDKIETKEHMKNALQEPITERKAQLGVIAREIVAVEIIIAEAMNQRDESRNIFETIKNWTGEKLTEKEKEEKLPNAKKIIDRNQTRVQQLMENITLLADNTGYMTYLSNQIEKLQGKITMREQTYGVIGFLGGKDTALLEILEKKYTDITEKIGVAITSYESLVTNGMSMTVVGNEISTLKKMHNAMITPTIREKNENFLTMRTNMREGTEENTLFSIAKSLNAKIHAQYQVLAHLCAIIGKNINIPDTEKKLVAKIEIHAEQRNDMEVITLQSDAGIMPTVDVIKNDEMSMIDGKKYEDFSAFLSSMKNHTQCKKDLMKIQISGVNARDFFVAAYPCRKNDIGLVSARNQLSGLQIYLETHELRDAEKIMTRLEKIYAAIMGEQTSGKSIFAISVPQGGQPKR